MHRPVSHVMLGEQQLTFWDRIESEWNVLFTNTGCNWPTWVQLRSGYKMCVAWRTQNACACSRENLSTKTPLTSSSQHPKQREVCHWFFAQIDLKLFPEKNSHVCLHILQFKPNFPCFPLSDYIDLIRARAQIISTEFDKIFRWGEKCEWIKAKRRKLSSASGR